MSGIFDEAYYNSVNYVDYLERGERYERTAQELITLLRSLNLDNNGPMCDFGCAVGHLTGAMLKQGYGCYGVDVSEWALQECAKKGLSTRPEIREDIEHGVVFALDVFEHMTEQDLEDLFLKMNTHSIVFRIPVVLNEGEDYVLECSRQDPTHIIRWTRTQWRDFFRLHGYVALDLQLHTVYNSPGVYSGILLHETYL